MLKLKQFLNNLHKDNNSTLCCFGKETIYGIEVSYKDTNDTLLSKDKQLRIMSDVYLGEETASEYINNERTINFNFNDLNYLKEFINELLINDFTVEFITKNKIIIWQNFKEL